MLCISKKKKHTGQRLFDLYKKQEHRGKQGYGFISIHEGHIKQVFRSKHEYSFKQALMKDNSEIILGHHRFPTSTKNVLGATHPIFVSHPELKFDYYIGHNGVITNSERLKQEHNKIGYNYTTEFTEKTVATYKDGHTEDISATAPVFNDSESLAIELVRWLEDLSTEIDTRGAAAFWGIAVEKGGTKVDSLFFGKNKGRDLCMLDSSKWYIISSETGDNLEDMKLWKLSIDRREFEEWELPIDVAEPRKATGFFPRNVYSLDDDNDGAPTHSQGVILQNIRAYDNLENAYYSQRERDETGVPASEFFAVTFAGVNMFVPNKFATEAAARVRFGETKPDLWSSIPDKTRERLEELAMDYARAQFKFEQIEDAVAGGFYDSSQYQAELDELEMKMLMIDESISTLDVDQKIVDEILDISAEMVANDASYADSIPSPYTLLLD